MTSTQAKQNFGELLEALHRGPVAIERHGKVRAIVSPPHSVVGQPDAEALRARRRAARAEHALVEKDRLIKHQRWAIELLLMPPAQRRRRLAQARAEVDRWRRDHLCSGDYIARWNALLSGPLEALIQAMSAADADWGMALLQNSPWSSARI